MDLITIGAAAAKLQMAPSALRYYDERGLVRSPARHAGRRMYGPDELRRLAFLKICQRLGIPLDAAAAVLHAPSEQWRQVIRQQIGELDELIARASQARGLLAHASECPADHPVRECPIMMDGLDRLVEGVAVEELMAELAGG